MLLKGQSLKRSVAVFDSDFERAERTCALLEQSSIGETINTQLITDYTTLRTMCSQGEIDVLFCEMYSCVRDSDRFDFLRGVVQSDPSMQVVYTGVDETNLLQAQGTRHAYLLPKEAEGPSLHYALGMALRQWEKRMERSFVVHANGVDRLISPNRVAFIESDRRKVRIHVGKEVIETYNKLSNLSKSMPSRFFQCHKSFLVNLGFIEELHRDYALLTTGAHVPVSQKRRKATREAFEAYVGRNM